MNERQIKNSELILFTDPPQDPSTAMDRDRELLAQYGTGFQTVIRFYQWKSPVISLGIIQDRSIIDMDKAAHDNIEITVRPTGGRHIYHQGDFCFSIIVPSKAESFCG